MREILFSVVLFLCFGCSNPDDSFNIENKGVLSPIQFEYKGHSYIEFRRLLGAGTIGVVHDPDCPCYKETNNSNN